MVDVLDDFDPWQPATAGVRVRAVAVDRDEVRVVHVDMRGTTRTRGVLKTGTGGATAAP